MNKLIAWFRIPRGLYCDRCPYWSIDKEHEHQNNGYCNYMKYGDWESEYLSLLWDGCKECNIKNKTWREILTFGVWY